MPVFTGLACFLTGSLSVTKVSKFPMKQVFPFFFFFAGWCGGESSGPIRSEFLCGYIHATESELLL